MSKSLIRSAIITGSAMVGITASVTTGAAGAWSDGSDSGFPQADAATNSTPNPQSSDSTATIPSASATTALITDGESSDDSTTTSHKKTVKKTVKKTTVKKTTKKTTTKPKTTPSSTPKNSATDGTFTGAATGAGFYGTVQVQVVVSGGRITDVNVLQAPSGRNDRYTNYAIPILTQETLSAQSANISTAGGASFTSRAFIKSLQSALTKAGM